MGLRPLSHIGPSLAVKFYKTWCFCSVGPYIEVFDFRTGASLAKCQIFKRNKVHGIKVHTENDSMIIYGAKSIAVVSVREIFEQENLFSHEKMSSEWIVAAEFNYSGSEIYLLSCYNRVLVLDLSCNIIAEKSLYGEKSILYSGSIQVQETSVIVIAGTVMNGIITWDLMNENKIHNLLDHDGAIFSVIPSDNGRFLASCSDDRSIKIWDLVTGELLSTAWGHTARIWSLRFFSSDSKLISVSEDCTCRVWSFTDNELRMTDIFDVHVGKNVWAVDVEEENMIAVTGGNDGRLKITDLHSEHSNSLRQWTLPQIAECCIDFKHLKNEIIKGFHWFDFGLVMITSEGRILQYFEETNSWNLIDDDREFFSFSIVNGTQDSMIIMNNKCCVKILQFDPSGNVKKIQDVFLGELSKTVNCLMHSSQYGTYLLVESPNPNDHLLCLEFDVSDMQIRNKYLFLKPKNMISSSFICYKKFLLIGSRFGIIHIFDLTNTAKDPIEVKVPANDAVTSIAFVEESKEKNLFSVTTRDGRFFFFEVESKELHVKIIHSSNISRGFLEGSYFTESGSFYIYGFKSNLFYIYNETEQYEVLTQPCGGAHRQWKLFQQPENMKALCFVQNSCLNWRVFKDSKFPQTLKSGLHGREIRDLSIMKKSLCDRETYLFLSGAEDTTLKLSSMNSRTGQIKNIWTQKSHVSGLQRCSFINDHFAVSCSAREELFLWELNDQFSRPYINLKCKLPTSTNNPDLRIMDFDVLFFDDSSNDFLIAIVYSDSNIKIWWYGYEKNEFHLVIHSRYETCCILNVLMKKFGDKTYLFISPTDGHVIHWDITRLIPSKDSDLKKWVDESGLLPFTLDQFIQKIHVHSAGIKSLDIEIREHCILIYTGGDDNALALLKYSLDEGTLKGQVLDFKESAASSTVTSVRFDPGSSKLWTTSVDQIIRIWDVEKDTLDMLDCTYTTVADTGTSDCITTDQGNVSLIGGLGLSCWKLDKP